MVDFGFNIYLGIAITGIFTGAGVAIGTWFAQKHILERIEKNGKSKNKANLALLEKEIRRQINFLDNSLSCSSTCPICAENYRALTKEVNFLKELRKEVINES